MVDRILTAMDIEIGRTLAALGLGTLGPNGRVLTSLNLENTMIVIVGDNGSYGPSVRPLDPDTGTIAFDPLHAKTTVYQTGVWVPLIIAGPMVVAPGRTVREMVNVADLFQLFGDVAGVDVTEIVPPSHTLDSKPLLPYLTTPGTAAIRTTNFTQNGTALFSPDPAQRTFPCQIGGLCNDYLFEGQSFCEDNGGTWWGPGGERQANTCCAVEKITGTDLNIAPVKQRAVRNRNFKLIELEQFDCSRRLRANEKPALPWAENPTTTRREFYDIRSVAKNPNGIDFTQLNMLKNCPAGQDPTTCLPTALDVTNYNALSQELKSIEDSVRPQNKCVAKGDGNMDLRVNQADLDGWWAFNGTGPSRYDINLDGRTDRKDYRIIRANQGLDCLDVCVRADLNRDGKVDAKDMRILNRQFRKCTDGMCGGDLDGDGAVNNRDVRAMVDAQRSCADNDRKNRSARAHLQ
jgi:hypothetical protein